MKLWYIAYVLMVLSATLLTDNRFFLAVQTLSQPSLGTSEEFILLITHDKSSAASILRDKARFQTSVDRTLPKSSESFADTLSCLSKYLICNLIATSDPRGLALVLRTKRF